MESRVLTQIKLVKNNPQQLNEQDCRYIARARLADSNGLCDLLLHQGPPSLGKFTRLICLICAPDHFVGSMAGGHRGIFDLYADDEALNTLDLTRALVKHISIPVVAAGAIMDGTAIQHG